MKDNMCKLAYAIIACLAIICVYLGLIPYYIDRVSSSGLAQADPRIAAQENKIKRGHIMDRQGKVLARSVETADGYAREYPLGSAAAHIVGYNSIKYGAAGIEKSMAKTLLGLDGGHESSTLRNRILGHPGVGDDVSLTVDAGLQQQVTGLLAGQKGAIVVLEPSTGAVLAMASYPDYDPARVENYLDHSDAPLLNRATSGAYPPGSIFKIVTAAAYRSVLPERLGDTIECAGQLEITGFTLRDNGVHGRVDFREAFVKSCNVAFGRYGLAVGTEEFTKQVQSFGIEKNFAFALPVYLGHITPPDKMDGPNLASSAIGQGEVLISPLQAAMLAAGVANNGVIMQPYIVSGYHGEAIGQIEVQPQEWLQAMDPLVAAAINEDMVAVVRHGTGKAAAVPGITVAGKTGSAENPHGQSHAWFVGFAPAQDPKVAVAVLLENAGGGGTVAAPLAREVIRQALELSAG